MQKTFVGAYAYTARVARAFPGEGEGEGESVVGLISKLARQSKSKKDFCASKPTPSSASPSSMESNVALRLSLAWS